MFGWCLTDRSCSRRMAGAGHGRRGARGGGGRGASGPFTPASNPGLLAWWDPDIAYITKDVSDKVSSWVSRDANAYVLSQVSGPAQATWSATGLLSKPSLAFAGAQFLEGADALAAIVDGSADYTLVVVLDGDGTGATSYYAFTCFCESGSSAHTIDHRTYGANANDRHYREAGSSGVLTAVGSQSMLTPSYYRAFVDGGATITTRVDDVASLTGATWTGSPVCNRTYVGCTRYLGVNSSFFSGKIADIILYDHDLTAGEWSRLKSWITAKYVGI